MCKILTTTIKSKRKLQIKKMKENNIIVENKVFDNLSIATNKMVDSRCGILQNKKEKSKLSAKIRRCNENNNISKLYLSLPVSPESRVLTCDDTHYLGHFEKTTIIKVSGYVLKLYKALEVSNQLMPVRRDQSSLVSLYSQTLIGIFWCNQTKKVVFTTPGLARMTGIYWCNIIGMPMKSIVIELGDRSHLDTAANVFLRFMFNHIRDRGIFSVQPSLRLQNMGDQRLSTSNQMIGKMPCSVWSSTELANDLRFDIIQPLVSRCKKTDNIIYIKSTTDVGKELAVNSEELRLLSLCGGPFSIYFNIDSCTTIAVDSEILSALGFIEEELNDTNIYSFIHLEDILPFYNNMKEILADKSVIKRDECRLRTAKEGIYRFCSYTLQTNGEQELILPNIFNSRSSTNQGEAYSQNIIDAFLSMDQEFPTNSPSHLGVQNPYFQARFIVMSYFYEDGIDVPKFQESRKSEPQPEAGAGLSESQSMEFEPQYNWTYPEWHNDTSGHNATMTQFPSQSSPMDYRNHDLPMAVPIPGMYSSEYGMGQPSEFDYGYAINQTVIPYHEPLPQYLGWHNEGAQSMQRYSGFFGSHEPCNCHNCNNGDRNGERVVPNHHEQQPSILLNELLKPPSCHYCDQFH